MKVSVIVPAYQAVGTIRRQLDAIGTQCGGRHDVEVIVADNGSTDGTQEAAAGCRSIIPMLRVVDASARRGPSAARNIGAEVASSQFLAFSDADDVVMPGWLEAVLSPPQPVFATGPVQGFRAEKDLPEDWTGSPQPPTHMNFLPYALGTNFIVSRALWRNAGGFREDLRTAEDVELSWRLQLGGAPLTYVPEARVGKSSLDSSLRTLKQYYSYGLRDPVLYAEFRHRGVPPPPLGASMRGYLGLLLRLPLLPWRSQRDRWLHQAGRRAGRLLGSIRAKCFYP